MNTIQKERKASKQYFLKAKDAKEDLVELSHDNVARVEAMIRYNSSYSNSSNTDNETSSAYWLKELKRVLVDKTKSKHAYKEILEKCVQYIDSENSTHLNTDGVGREQMAERLAVLGKDKLVEYLRNPVKGNYKLIEKLSKKTIPKDNKHYGRENYSFATKFCHYACYYLFEGLPEQDNFSIYDNVVAGYISEYAKYYGVQLPQDDISKYKNYESYLSLIDEIIRANKKQTHEEISRNGFDHLLWYFHKGRK